MRKYHNTNITKQMQRIEFVLQFSEVTLPIISIMQQFEMKKSRRYLTSYAELTLIEQRFEVAKR